LQTAVSIIIRAVLIGMLITFVGSAPRSALFLANLRIFPQIPWAVPITALYLWFFWRYLHGAVPPESTSLERKHNLHANPLPARAYGFGHCTRVAWHSLH
jgi:hypothetical protein